MKRKVHKLIEKGANGSRINKLFDYSIMGLIILNVIAIILETVPEINRVTGTLFKYFELFSILVFTLEYLLRIYVSELNYPNQGKIKAAMNYIFSAYGIIDLLSVLPFYLFFLVKIDLRILRILRLMQFFRMLKVNRYNNSLNLIWSVIKNKRGELMVTGFIAFLIILISSFLMYYAEKDIQPDKFTTLFDSFWWAIVTLTTVGYGDLYPITTLGRILGGVVSVIGVGIVALPTALIGSGFIDELSKKKKKETSQSCTCPHCGKEIDTKL